MGRMRKSDKEEWDFFIDPSTGRRKYNDKCRQCVCECKQSYRATIVRCPKYESKRRSK